MDYKFYVVIDEKGYKQRYVEVCVAQDSVEIVQDYTLPEDYSLVSVHPSSGLINPHWNGTEWVEGIEADAVLTIDELKIAKKAEIANARWQAETGGIQFNGIAIVTDRESQSLINGAVTSTLLDPTYTARWKTINGFVALDAPMIQAVATAVRNHVQTCFDREAALYAEIEAVDTADSAEYIEALKAIMWELT